jgi:DHA1 family bicyclomycin/chloramphenicol resistance-like MFS transporter
MNPERATASRAHVVRVSAPVPITLLVATAFMGAVSPFATDLYLPAFPALARELHSTATGVQFTLTAFLLGAAIGQLVLGPLSDRLGRRGPLIVGASLCCIASLVAVIAPSLTILIAARLVQGASGAAGMVIGRAVVADIATGVVAARAFSVMMSIAGIAPIGAPVIGGLLADSVGWRGIFLIVFVLTVGVLAVTVFLIPETMPARRRAQLRSGRTTEVSARRELTSTTFLGYAVVSGFGFAALLAYVSASPFLYQEVLGMTPAGYGAMFAINSVVLIGCTFTSSRLVARLGLRALVGAGLLTMGVAIFAIFLVSWLKMPPMVLAFVLPVMLGGFGFVQGSAVAGALSAVPRAAGTASAIIGFTQFALSGISAALVSVPNVDPTWSLAIVLAASTGIAFAGYATTFRTRSTTRRKRPGSTPR